VKRVCEHVEAGELEPTAVGLPQPPDHRLEHREQRVGMPPQALAENGGGHQACRDGVQCPDRRRPWTSVQGAQFGDDFAAAPQTKQRLTAVRGRHSNLDDAGEDDRDMVRVVALAEDLVARPVGHVPAVR
jgi:hypothetical protein